MIDFLPLIAVDIGSSAIKIVELSGPEDDKKLNRLGLESLPPGCVVDGSIMKPEHVTEVMKVLLKKLKINTFGRRAALSLGGSNVIIKKLDLDPTAYGETLGEQIHYEAEQHFNQDINDLFYSYATLENPFDETNSMSVILAGCRQEVVSQHIDVVKGTGLGIGVVECDVFSVSNMFEYSYGISDSMIALINIGAANTQISLLYGGVYLYTRDVPIGGQEYTQLIMEKLQVSQQEAESIKISASNGEGALPSEVVDEFNNINEQLVNEIRMTIDFFFQSGDAPAGMPQLSELFLIGGGAKTLGLDAALASTFLLQVNIVNPFQRILVNESKFEMDYIVGQGHIFGVATGLALRTTKDIDEF